MTYSPDVTQREPDHLDRIVEQWAHERPDVDVTALATMGRLFRIADLAHAELGRGLHGYKLPPGWFDVLAALRRAGDPFELSPTALMHAMMLSSGGVTKRLDRLVEARLVTRRPDPDDRRGVLVRLTPRGRQLIDRALVEHVANEEELLEALTAAEQGQLDDLLRRLLAGLEPGGPAPGAAEPSGA
jgi:DNA-binding MarR family transcriptional regulator